jgi:ankyrin repeat protein
MLINSNMDMNQQQGHFPPEKKNVNSKLIDLYARSDYVPLLSTITNAGNLIGKIFIKCFGRGEAGSLRCLYATHIEYKSVGECARLMLPVLNITFAIQDDSNRKYDNPEWMLDAIKKDASQMQFASKRLKKDKSFMLLIVKHDGSLIKYADPFLSSDFILASCAFEQNSSAFTYINEEIKPKIIVDALAKSPNLFSSANYSNVNINAKDKSGSTALILAAGKGDNLIVDALIAAGADLNVQDSSGWTALKYAVATGDKLLVDALIKARAGLNLQDSSGSTPLILAAGKGDNLIVDALIAAGANLNLQNSSGSTALTLAAVNGNKLVVDALIAAEAELDLQDSSGSTALMFAASFGHKLIVEALITAGANPNILNNKGDCPFFKVSRMRRNKDWKNIKKILMDEMKKTELGSELIALKKRLNSMVLLAHAWEIGGDINLIVNKQNVTYELEGFKYPKILAKIVKHTGGFLESVFRPGVGDIRGQMFDSLMETYTCSGTYMLKSLDAPALLNRWKSGKPVLIPTGYSGHSIMVLLWGEYLVICNRGGDDLNVKIHLFDPEANKPERSDIEGLFESRKLDQNNWMQTIANVSKKLNCTPMDSLESSLNGILLSQKVGNCVYASSEGMAFIFLALSHLKPGERKFPSGITWDEIYPLFANWRDFQRLCFLRPYLTYLESRAQGVDNVERRFLKTVLNEGLRRESTHIHCEIWADQQLEAWKFEKKRIEAILQPVQNR